MEALHIVIMILRIELLFLLIWYLWQRCREAYEERRKRAQRRYQFQTVWRSSLICGDELDNIISK